MHNQTIVEAGYDGLMTIFPNVEYQSRFQNAYKEVRRWVSIFIFSLITNIFFVSTVNSEERIPQYIFSQESHFQPPKTVEVAPNISQIENIDTLAIIEMRNLTKDPNISLKLHTVLVKYFLKTNRFKVLERKRFDKIIQELEIGTTSIIDEKKASTIGKMLGAKAILIGEIRQTRDANDYKESNGKAIKIGSHPMYEAYLRLISVETSTILWIDSIAFDNKVKPQSVETHLNQLLLKPKTVKLKMALLTSYYDNVRGIGPKKYLYRHDEKPTLVIALENAQYVNISYSCFKKDYSKPIIGGNFISLDHSNYGRVFELPSGETFKFLAKAEGITNLSEKGIFTVQIKAEEKLIHEIHYVIK